MIPSAKIIKHKVVMRDDVRCGKHSVVSRITQASIKTTAEIYTQEFQASVRSAINSRTRAIFSQCKNELNQLENPFSHSGSGILPNLGTQGFQVRLQVVCKWLKRMAPQVGLEPT